MTSSRQRFWSIIHNQQPLFGWRLDHFVKGYKLKINPPTLIRWMMFKIIL